MSWAAVGVATGAGCAGPWVAPSNGSPDNEAVGGVGSSRAR